MLNVDVPEECGNDQKYQEVYEDIDECRGYGEVLDVRILKPAGNDRKFGDSSSIQKAQMVDEAIGVGRVYVKFADSQAAQAALKTLAGRSFVGKGIVATLSTDDSQMTPLLNLIFVPQPGLPSFTGCLA